MRETLQLTAAAARGQRPAHAVELQAQLVAARWVEADPVSANGDVSASARMRINAIGGGSDGMRMDCAGNLYATAAQRVVVLDPNGAEIGSIAVPQAESVTNVAFGGPEQRTLFITSMGSGTQRGVFRVELNVPGLPY